jgi:hypothetical protein
MREALNASCSSAKTTGVRARPRGVGGLGQNVTSGTTYRRVENGDVGRQRLDGLLAVVPAARQLALPPSLVM